MFYIKDAITPIISHTNEYKFNFVANKGGVFYLENSVLNDVNSKFHYNSALYGGISYCKSCSMTFSSSEMNYHRAYQAGLLYIESYSASVPFIATNLLVNDVKSYSRAGAIMLLGSALQTFTFSTCTV